MSLEENILKNVNKSGFKYESTDKGFIKGYKVCMEDKRKQIDGAMEEKRRLMKENACLEAENARLAEKLEALLPNKAAKSEDEKILDYYELIPY